MGISGALLGTRASSAVALAQDNSRNGVTTISIRLSGTFTKDSSRWESRSSRPVPDDVVRGAADGDDVWRTVAVEVASAQVLGGDLGVEYGAGPFPARPVEIIHRDPMIGAAVAGEDLVVAVAIDVGDPEGVAIGQGRVEDRARSELERSVLAFRPDDDLAAVPGLDRRQEVPAVIESAKVDLAAAALGGLAGCPRDEALAVSVNEAPLVMTPSPTMVTPSLSAVRTTERPCVAGKGRTSIAWITGCSRSGWRRQIPVFGSP